MASWAADQTVTRRGTPDSLQVMSHGTSRRMKWCRQTLQVKGVDIVHTVSVSGWAADIHEDTL
ncbi:hypothetical protein [Pseudarthrobacter sp. NBSH8]|uniref:hypothetical protein n=1 Tax=Pseudarthrobacter sp. NBSH8 TaxID=2596911 RepID=UPI00186262F9|nr:hypothetical protein [Pseudarthrobacter sp. NBSH8]QNE14415.1 hypothetical protein FYJ92_08180 [Pseudarthrobacter sp. NBSH8]